jgi:hypothetical protein
MGTSNAASPSQLRRRYRLHAREQLYDESGAEPIGWAIYTLSDPRDIREVRYVGQTTSPRRRFLQHLNHAQLSLPAELPWWIQQPKLRPLYTWMRELYADDARLPVMVICSWQFSIVHARHAERARIYDYLTRGRHLLNVESEILGSQLALL